MYFCYSEYFMCVDDHYLQNQPNAVVHWPCLSFRVLRLPFRASLALFLMVFEQIPISYVSPYIRSGISLCFPCSESHRVKIGKVQSGRQH